MKQRILFLLCVVATSHGFCQTADDVGQSNTDSLRVKNYYTNRKYSFSISESLYGSFSHYHPFGIFEINFCDRLEIKGLSQNASLSGNAGIAFMPFQGTRLHVGGNYELLSKRLKVNIDLGGQYALGLAQATTMTDGTNIYLGYHHYLVPYIGIIYWPGKDDASEIRESVSKEGVYLNPKFWQLFYFKLQFSYSFLISPLQVDSSGAFDPHTYSYIVRNTGNTFSFKIAVGVNIPSFGRRERDLHLREQYLQK